MPTNPQESTVDLPASLREHVLDFDPGRLVQFFAAIGEKPFRAKQVLEWVYQHGAGDFAEMTNLPKVLRERLARRLVVYAAQVIRRSVSSDDTVKLLLQWRDGATSECVMIPDGPRRTACIGSQVGCPVQCRFCASGLDGLQRNLTAGEIVEQVLRLAPEGEARDVAQPPPAVSADVAQPPSAVSAAPAVRQCHTGKMPVPHTSAASRGVTNIVFMGSGEPLANYDAVMRSVRTLNAPWGLNVGARRITISTVGLSKQIRRLADEGLQLNLALSLHAPTDGLRQELIPWAEKISLAELTDACRYYFDKTGREITLEYILLHEVNDRRSHAEQLVRFAGQIRCNVNLIRYNSVEGLPFGRPTREATAAFQRHLREHGVNVHLRTSRGLDIDAACGQLRRREMRERTDG